MSETFSQLTRADDDALHWRCPSLVRFDWVLVAGDRHFGRLWTDSHWDDRVLRAAMGAGEWEFRLRGAWRPSLTVHRAASSEPLGTVTLDLWTMRSATFELEGAGTFVWTRTGFFTARMAWTTPDGAELIAFRPGTDESAVGDYFKTQCRVDYTDAGFTHPQRDLLTCLGWHIAVLSESPAV